MSICLYVQCHMIRLLFINFTASNDFYRNNIELNSQADPVLHCLQIQVSFLRHCTDVYEPLTEKRDLTRFCSVLVPVLVLNFVALWFIPRGDSF